jgi:hypothetical protein
MSDFSMEQTPRRERLFPIGRRNDSPNRGSDSVKWLTNRRRFTDECLFHAPDFILDVCFT